MPWFWPKVKENERERTEKKLLREELLQKLRSKGATSDVLRGTTGCEGVGRGDPAVAGFGSRCTKAWCGWSYMVRRMRDVAGEGGQYAGEETTAKVDRFCR